jgi:ribosomal protein S18 acetylase RimI-like enzyme
MKDRKVRVLLALHNGVVVRMMVVKLKKPERYLKGKLMGKISVAFIDEKYRGKGVGRLLFREAIKWFKKHKIKYVRLTVHSKNKIGLSAWTKYGFREFTKDMKLDL